MRKNFLAFVLLFVSVAGFSQSPKQVVIEHFTNTKCSICASRNPGFYSVLANYPQVIHIAYHPSAPYQNCYFNLQNKPENDARTNYYNTYGSTPDYFLNGKQLPSANPAINTTTIDTALNQFSPVEVRAYEELITTDSIKVTVTVKTTGATSLSTVKLFTGVAEEPVNYNASNGETVHHDVFRKALTAPEGNFFALPSLNDSVVFTFYYQVLSGWNINNLHTMALVQRDDTKEVLNADNSERVVVSGISELADEELVVYPNPATEILEIRSHESDLEQSVLVFDLSGRKLLEQKITDNRIDISAFTKGIYFLKAGNAVKKFVKE